MSSKMRRLITIIAIVASTVPVTGCRNPFLPSADVQISDIFYPGLGTAEMTVFSVATPDYYLYRVGASFWLLNKVGVNITSVNVFYTDMVGNPVSAYAASGGKTIKLQTRLYPPTTNDPNGSGASIILLALDTRVYQALQDPTLSPKVIFCTMTFRGEDDNGYDVKLTAQFTIKGYGF